MESWFRPSIVSVYMHACVCSCLCECICLRVLSVCACVCAHMRVGACACVSAEREWERYRKYVCARKSERIRGRQKQREKEREKDRAREREAGKETRHAHAQRTTTAPTVFIIRGIISIPDSIRWIIGLNGDLLGVLVLSLVAGEASEAGVGFGGLVGGGVEPPRRCKDENTEWPGAYNIHT